MEITSRYRADLAALAALSLLALASCGDSQSEGGEFPPGGGGGANGGRAIPVAARIAEPVEMEVILRGSANLRAREMVEVLPKQAGVVARILVEEGAAVRAGQPLAVLDDEEWRLQVQQSDARTAAARDAAERAVALHQQGLLADQELERLRSEAAIAAADRELARLRVRNSVIEAPIAGVVTHRWIERGQLVNSSGRAFAVADVSRLEVDVGVPERESRRVRVGQTARLRVEGSGASVPGRVSRVRPVVDPASGTVQVTVEVAPREADRLRAGQFVNVDIITETLAERIALPRTAVLVDGATPRVFILQNGRAVEREVALGTSQGDQVEIETGIVPGDTVVIVGQDNLRPGLPIRLMELNGLAVQQQSANRVAGADGQRGAPSPEAGSAAGTGAAGSARGESREQIEARLRQSGMSPEQARERAEQIERRESGTEPPRTAAGAREGGSGGSR